MPSNVCCFTFSFVVLCCKTVDMKLLFSLQSKINLELTYDTPAVSGTGRGGGEDEDDDEDEAGGKWDIVKKEEKGECVCSIFCNRRFKCSVIHVSTQMCCINNYVIHLVYYT